MKSPKLFYVVCFFAAMGLPACSDDSGNTSSEEKVICGNGILEGEEICDDGNAEAGDGCSDSCTIEAGWSCSKAGTPCTEDEPKEQVVCGDGKKSSDEACDDGNTEDGDGCSSDCKVEDGWRCPTPGESCVERTGDEEAVCGDGLLDGEETCDDGNAADGDGCSSGCALEDGWQCQTPGEPCVKDTNVDEVVCGDGHQDGEETCDDGNTDDGDGCSALCAIEDGWECQTAGQPCVKLVTTVCGDGQMEDKETCDDGNAKDGDGCSAQCILEEGWVCAEVGKPCVTVCGDGILAGKEECDDGNNKDDDGCSSKCIVEEAYLCEEAGKPCTPEFDDKTSIKILGLGNSFMVNSAGFIDDNITIGYLHDILKAMGYEDITVGVLYIGGKSINYHAQNIKKGNTVEKYYLDDKGKHTETKYYSYLEAIKSKDWDYFIMQTYPSNVPDLYNDDIDYVVNLVKENSPKLPVFGWSMTWALQTGKPHPHLTYAGYYPQKMYEGTVLSVLNKIKPRKDIPLIIPVGTAIQNLRHGILADNLNRDGYHLSYNNGEFAAALMWAKQITKRPIGKLNFKPSNYTYTDRQIEAIKEAVINAYKTPYAVTTPKKGVLGSYLKPNEELRKAFADAGHDLKEFVEIPIGVTTKAMYNATTTEKDVCDLASAHIDTSQKPYVKYCYSEMLSAETGSKNADLNKYAASRIFNRYEIPNGSFIVIKSGYEYRPEGWTSLIKATDSSKRPDVVKTAITEVNDAWWSDFQFRAFNLAKSGAPALNDEEMEKLESAMSIFVPIHHDNAEDVLVKASYDLSKYKKLDLSMAYRTCWDSNHESTSLSELTMPDGSYVFPTKLFTSETCKKYAATRIFSKSEIPNGSLIVVAKGYRYIPDAWVDLDITNKGKERRPNAVVAKDEDSIITVDDAWWGEFTYRGFDIAKANLETVPTPSEQYNFGEVFAIYTPVSSDE